MTSSNETQQQRKDKTSSTFRTNQLKSFLTKQIANIY